MMGCNYKIVAPLYLVFTEHLFFITLQAQLRALRAQPHGEMLSN